MAKKRAKGARTRRSRIRRGDAPVTLTPLGKWQTQMQRLQEWRARVDANPTMQGDAWKQGQLRHIDDLIAQHEAAKPA